MKCGGSQMLVALLAWGIAEATEVLPDQFPSLSTEASVEEAEVAADGGVFLQGNFTSVDGVTRPGLAKLRADGTLDPSFAPLAAEDLSIIDEFGSQIFRGWGGREDELFALENGGLMRANSWRFEVRIETGLRCFSWTMMPGAAARYSRLKVSR